MSKNAFGGRSSSDPGMVLPAAGSGTVVSLRVYNEGAVNSPGVLYKAIMATSELTAAEVIKQVLERFGEDGVDPSDFELQYNVIPETKKSKRLSFRGSRKGSKKTTHVLDNEESPVLVAEWFSDQTRRFELHPKPIRATKRSRSSKNFIMVPPTQSAAELPSINEEPVEEKEVPTVTTTKSGKEQPYFTYMSNGAQAIHVLAEGTTLVGSGKQADLVLGGEDVKQVHFEVINMRGRIALVPSSGSALYVEDKLIDKPVILQNGASLSVGRGKTHTLTLHVTHQSQPGGQLEGITYSALDAGSAVEIYSALKEDAQQRVAELSESYRQGLRDGMDLVAAVIDDEDFQFREEEMQDPNLSTIENLAVEFLEVSDLRGSPSVLGQRLINDDPINSANQSFSAIQEEPEPEQEKPPLKSSDSLILQQNQLDDEEC